MVVLRDSGELESDEPIEELNCSYSSPPTTYSPPGWPTNFSDFPPSPTCSPVWGPTSFPPSPPSSPLYLPALPPPPSPSTSSPLRVRTRLSLFYEHEDIVDLPVVDFALFVDYLIEHRGGELNVINGLEGGTLNVVNGLEGSALNVINHLEGNTLNMSTFEINELEQHHEDIIDQLVIDYAGVDYRVIGYMGGELHKISGEGVFTISGAGYRHEADYRQGQALSTTPEPSVVFEAKLSVRVWLGHRGQWVVDFRYGWNWLNLGTFRTADGAPLPSESVKRLRGGKDLFNYLPFLIENRSEPLQLPPTAQEENQNVELVVREQGIVQW